MVATSAIFSGMNIWNFQKYSETFALQQRVQNNPDPYTRNEKKAAFIIRYDKKHPSHCGCDFFCLR